MISKVFHAWTEEDLGGIATQITSLLKFGQVISLEGDLGAGKTALARALLRTLKNDPTLDVPSPTYTLVQTYDTPKGPVWHFDLYRLKSPDEIYEIGWEDALAENALLLIEWAERIENLLPYTTGHIKITAGADGTRTIEVSL